MKSSITALMPTHSDLAKLLAQDVESAGFEKVGRAVPCAPLTLETLEAATKDLSYDQENTALQLGVALLNLHERVVRFQREKFPHQPLLAKLKHLCREARELHDCNGSDPMEFADVFLLNLGCADVAGIELLTFLLNAHLKMSICEKREWHDADADGVHHHKD